MERAENEVPREGGTHRNGRRLGIANLADDENIRVLPQKGAQAVVKFDASFRINLALTKSVTLILHRIFQSGNADVIRRNLPQSRIQGRRLAAPRRTADEKQAVFAADDTAYETDRLFL